MRRALLLALVATAVATPALAMPGHGGHAPAARVSMGFSNYTPSTLTVVAGDVVRFTNDSVRAHTVSADDDSFDSGRLQSGRSFDLTTKKAGDVAYHCALHPGITGEVRVRDVVLGPPSSAAAPGKPYPLDGRSDLAPHTELTIQADAGEGFRDAGTATVRDNGSFSTSVLPTTTASYRAVAGDTASDPVRLVVHDRTVTVTTKRSKGRDVVTATVSPASPGDHVVLQLDLPDRFGWWPVQRARLNGRSQARFVLRTRRRLAARVNTTLADGATTLASSRVVHVGPVKKRSRPAPHRH
ncbi:MAG TPA: hypothetical protein VFZ89_05560 [Solirubrobacteraceae bacterium]